MSSSLQTEGNIMNINSSEIDDFDLFDNIKSSFDDINNDSESSLKEKESISSNNIIYEKQEMSCDNCGCTSSSNFDGILYCNQCGMEICQYIDKLLNGDHFQMKEKLLIQQDVAL